jgi:ech hydrogenase subunit A
MLDTLAFILIVLPFLAALGCFAIRASAIRSLIIVATSALLVAAFILLLFEAPTTFTPETILGVGVREVIQVADFLLLALIFYFGIRHKSALIIAFAVAQLGLASYLEFGLSTHEYGHPTFVVDSLALVMVAIITVVGGAIAIHAVPYMKAHEEHLHLEKSRQPQFFFVLILFLGAMNGLVLTNDISFFYFFWEVTTLCSFLLIGHDKTEIATKNAVRALWMNSLGGVALLTAIVWFYLELGTFDIQNIIAASPEMAIMMVPLALLCFGAFTKAAQVPFQSWLLGAMVAPTPVSAMLHSSTMVKAGVYAVVRFAPAFTDTYLGYAVALIGAFTFLATAALAVGQSNGKKILAYSTISNLGLIVACAGIGTPAAAAAAMMIIVFHAVSKGLLFLCVGTIEQRIGSRDIEDMRGVYAEMPVTALITVIAVITMILPPFGMLLGKWMAIESAASDLALIIMLAIGSALTVLYWARWAGGVMSAPFRGKVTVEDQPILTRWPLLGLCIGAVVVSFGAPWLYTELVAPALVAFGSSPFEISQGVFGNPAGAFAVVPLFIVVIVGFFFAVRAMRKTEVTAAAIPYMGGLQNDDGSAYIGPMNQEIQVESGHYYMSALFGEEKLSRWVNGAALALLALMFVMGGMQ